jgi:hypothetical protein
MCRGRGRGKKMKSVKRTEDEINLTARPQLDQNMTDRPFFDGAATVSKLSPSRFLQAESSDSSGSSSCPFSQYGKHL